MGLEVARSETLAQNQTPKAYTLSKRIKHRMIALTTVMIHIQFELGLKMQGQFSQGMLIKCMFSMGIKFCFLE